MAKNLFFVKNILGQPTKHNFELRVLKLLENHVNKNLEENFSFFFFIKALFFQNSDQKVPKKSIFRDFFFNIPVSHDGPV